MLKKFFKVSDDDNYEEIYEDEEYEEVLDNEENIGQVALDILDTWDELVILAPVAGIELKDVDLSFFNQVLKNKECYWGKFSRKIILPENLNFEAISAGMENNMLIIKIPKLQFSSHNIRIDRL